MLSLDLVRLRVYKNIFCHLSSKINFIGFFEHHILTYIFYWKKQLYECILKKLTMNRSVEAFLDIHFIPRQNEPSSIVVGSKLFEELSFECRKTSLLRRVVVLQKNESIEGTNTSRTNRRHKGWILLGYPSNTPEYPSKYCNYTSKRKLGLFPHFPPDSI